MRAAIPPLRGARGNYSWLRWVGITLYAVGQIAAGVMR